MKGIKNFIIKFINEPDSFERVDSEQAKAVLNAWGSGAKVIVVNGNGYATHQIASIKRCEFSEENQAICKYLKKLGLDDPRAYTLAHVPTVECKFTEEFKKIRECDKNLEISFSKEDKLLT